MKQQQSIVKRGICRSVFLAMSAVLACAIAVLLAGGIGTNTSAKAATWELSDNDAKIEIESFQSGTVVENAAFLSNVTLKNNINSSTTNAHVYFSNTNMPTKRTFLFIPKQNPFADLEDYEVSSVTLLLDGERKDCLYYNALPHFYPYVFMSGAYFEGVHIPSVVVTYTLAKAEKEPVPLPPDPVKEGYNFIGWYYDAEFTRVYDGKPIYEDTQLYAKFVIKRFSVTFDPDGGSEVNTQTVDWNTAATLAESTRAGYNFMGWFLPDGTQYTNQPIKEDTVLTARWELKMYTVTFYVDGEVHTTLQVPYGSTLEKAMRKAKVADYGVKDIEGTRISKYSTITEDTAVLIHELNGWEKYGDFVARSPWYTWLMVGLGSALAVAFSITVVLLVKARR